MVAAPNAHPLQRLEARSESAPGLGRGMIEHVDAAPCRAAAPSPESPAKIELAQEAYGFSRREAAHDADRNGPAGLDQPRELIGGGPQVADAIQGAEVRNRPAVRTGQ